MSRALLILRQTKRLFSQSIDGALSRPKCFVGIGLVE